MVDIDKLMKLHNKATEGPWKVTDKCAHLYITDSNPNREIAKIGRKPKHHEENAAYIVAACNSIPDLIYRIRELEEEVESLREALEESESRQRSPFTYEEWDWIKKNA